MALGVSVLKRLLSLASASFFNNNLFLFSPYSQLDDLCVYPFFPLVVLDMVNFVVYWFSDLIQIFLEHPTGLNHRLILNTI